MAPSLSPGRSVPAGCRPGIRAGHRDALPGHDPRVAAPGDDQHRDAGLGGGYAGADRWGLTQIVQGLAASQALGALRLRVWFLTMLAEAYGQGGRLEQGLEALAEAFLSYAVNDARSVVAALARLGFTSERVFLLLDAQATRQGIENVLYEHLRGAGTNDRLFVFFAGHGETVSLPRGDTEGFLLPYDANLRNLFTTAISMSDVRRIGQRIAAKHILFAVDAC